MAAVYIALLLISAATLALQVALTRFFALAQGSHLAFMAVSLALLGSGASGTYLSLRQVDLVRLRRLVTHGAILFSLTVPAAYLAINYLPFDTYRLAWEPVQWLWLVLYYLALTVPFFFSGLVIGAALAAAPGRAGPTYAANLLGSALGPPLALPALATVGGPGTVFMCALLGWLAVGSANWFGRPSCLLARRGLPVIMYALVAALLVLLMLQPPDVFNVRLNPYKTLSQALLYPGSDIIFSQWNAFSRVDVIRSEGIRSAPGLSFTYPGQIPPQLGLLVDGDNLSPITRPEDPAFTRYLPPVLAFQLRPNAQVLILEPGGGLSVLTGLQSGASTVTVVHANPTVARVVAQEFADFTGDLYTDPRVTVIIDTPRSFLRRTTQQFDLILMPLTDSFHPVTAGAYSLNEDYRYTVEAFSDALSHLTPQGLLVVERWLQVPPTESLRLWGTAVEALVRQGLTAPGAHLLALRSLQTSLIIAARSPLPDQDIVTARHFAQELQFDLIWLPGITPEETNRYSVLAEPFYYNTFAGLLVTSNPDLFFAGYPYAVAPPTDNHPYFFHFFKWSQTPEILQTLGKTWQPFGGTGYLVLLVLLGLVLALSAVLILLPLLWRRRGREIQPEAARAGSPAPYLLYFALLGLGFLLVEIPLLQQFILYLGQPAYAFAIVTSAILLASGMGSGYLSGRLSLRLALPLIVILALLYPLLLPALFNITLRLPFLSRVVVTVVALFPLGLLLGVPFPRGLALVEQTAPGLTPWAWAVNGCASVISAVLAAIISLTWGFSAVMWGAAAAYGLAGVVIRLKVRSSTAIPSDLESANSI